ncbi:MAG: lipid A biosynthesis lauroyl acyltransferase [Gammaproteobacteria bacterium]
MQLLFYVVTLIPLKVVRIVTRFIVNLGVLSWTSGYKITKINLKLCYKDLSDKKLKSLTNKSYIESIISIFETLNAWSRPIHVSGKKIYRIENNFLISRNIKEKNGLAIISIHNRSVDLLLKWANANIQTVSLYKKIKLSSLNKFVKSQRESKNSVLYETSILGTRKIFKAYKSNKTICIVSDQVPQRGMGEYVKFFNIDAYTATLAPTLVQKLKKPAVFACIHSFKNNMLGITIKPCKENMYSKSEYQLSLNQSIEELININPIDYAWEYKRFRRQQSGEDFYSQI